MSMDYLQERIRKLKTPIVLDMGIRKDQLSPQLLEKEGTHLQAYGRFCREILEKMKGAVPAVRFRLARFAFLGPEGLVLLSQLTLLAKELGYYVLLDLPEALCPQDAQEQAEALKNVSWQFDGIVLCSYMGSDGIKPYILPLREMDKDLFCVIRTGNKSAPELQDLLTGGRLVHVAAADIVSRLGKGHEGRCGYSRIAAVSGASDSLRTLRQNYKSMFLLVDSYDYANASAKRCAYAFDRLGHGAAICVGSKVTAAWIDAETDGVDYLDQAVKALERMKKNLSANMTVL